MAIQLMAALLVLLLLLAVSLTANDVYYVTADNAAGREQSCPPHQICHSLSYYISQPDSYFTSDTTIIFLEGNHSFDEIEFVRVSNVHNLTLKGQGQWPVAGAEETVMQSTVTINCTRGRGGFYFATSHNIIVEGLTVTYCGGFLSSTMRTSAVFYFEAVANLFFHKNSLQHMTGNGLFVLNCENVTVTNCSYYHSVFCDIHSQIHKRRMAVENGSGVAIVYNKYTQYSNTGYTLELSHSNMTKCCKHQNGGGIWLKTHSQFGSATVLFSYLVLTHNKASQGGGLAAELYGHDNVTLKINNCRFSNGSALHWSGGMYFSVSVRSWITVENTNLVENSGHHVCEIEFFAQHHADKITLSLLNSTISHGQTFSNHGVKFHGWNFHITLNNTRMRFANILDGLFLKGRLRSTCTLQMVDSQLEGSRKLQTVTTINQILANITNCTFSNNSGSDSVISIFPSNIDHTLITSSIITDNNMTGITLIDTGVRFIGRNVIQNNRHTEGAGIKLVQQNAYIEVDGELFLVNNTADLRGGAILVSIIPLIYIRLPLNCSIQFISDNSSVTFSGNRAGKGGSDIYNAMLSNCYNSRKFVKHLGHRNTTSWYFHTRLKKQLHFSNTDQLSSMSSDPIMVCFCNTNSNLPDCSNRTWHHIEAYPGLVISSSIATVGYYGGASPGDVLVSAERATLVRYYGQSSSTCFQLHILLQNTTSTTALVNIRVDGGLYGWGVSIIVGIKDCPIGFTEDKISGQCRCEQLLDSIRAEIAVSVTEADHCFSITEVKALFTCVKVP